MTGLCTSVNACFCCRFRHCGTWFVCRLSAQSLDAAEWFCRQWDSQQPPQACFFFLLLSACRMHETFASCSPVSRERRWRGTRHSTLFLQLGQATIAVFGHMPLSHTQLLMWLALQFFLGPFSFHPFQSCAI